MPSRPPPHAPSPARRRRILRRIQERLRMLHELSMEPIPEAPNPHLHGFGQVLRVVFDEVEEEASGVAVPST